MLQQVEKKVSMLFKILLASEIYTISLRNQVI